MSDHALAKPSCYGIVRCQWLRDFGHCTGAFAGQPALAMGCGFCSWLIERCRWVGHSHSYQSGPWVIYPLLSWIPILAIDLHPFLQSNFQNWNFHCLYLNPASNLWFRLDCVFTQVHWWILLCPRPNYAHSVWPQTNSPDSNFSQLIPIFRQLSISTCSS